MRVRPAPRRRRCTCTGGSRRGGGMRDGAAAVRGGGLHANPPPPHLLRVARSYLHVRSIIGSRSEDLFRRTVRRAVFQQTLFERRVLAEGAPRPLTGQLGGD